MLKYILSTATFRQSQITILGTILNGALGAFFYILLARFLGPADFGLLSVSIATLTLIADIADLGTNTGLVKFVSESLVSDKSQALRFLKLGLETKLVVWLGIFLFGFLLSPFIATQIFNKTELIIPLRLVMIGVGGALLISFATSSLQSFQKYFTWSVVNILTNLTRLVSIFVLLFYQQLNITSSLLSFIMLPFFGFLLALFFLPTSQILSSKNEFSLASNFFKYNFSVAAFTVIAAISARLDTFLGARLLSNFELGIYGAMNQLVQVVPQIVSALGVVAAPKFANFQNESEMLTYFKKFQLLVLGISLLVVFVTPLSFYLIPLIYGSEYIQAVVPFIILLLGMLIFLISVPLHSSIIYYFAKPQVFIWISIGHLLIIGILGYFLISTYGVIGAAIAVLAGMLFNFIAPLLWFLKRISKK